MTGKLPTVFIVDDASEVRTALSRMLCTAGYCVRSFETAEGYLEQQDIEVPGCLLLDICLPGLSGIDLQRALVGTPRARPIIFLSGMGDIQTSVHAMKAGAIDFLTKPVEAKRVFAAIEQAFRHDADQRRDQVMRACIQGRLERLTPREHQVMMQVVRGRLNKQIAADLGTGEKTVKVHRARVMFKMGVRSVPELVQLGACVGVAFEPVLNFPTATLNWQQMRSNV
jgi:FixJ family two-component response regulator